MEELQTQFIKSQGKPISVGDNTVVQLDIIPLRKGTLVIRFETDPLVTPVGIAIKSNKGHIVLSDGRKEKLVFIWNKQDLPREVIHEVYAPDSQIKIWNIYQVNLSSPTKADYWTNNSGMVVEPISGSERVYHCSDGLGEFDKTELKVRLSWSSD